MSVQQIAKLAGVSVATVSRVLNNLPSVKPANRDKVLSVIESLNYQPNLLARQLRTARSGMLLVMVSNIANPFCAAIVKGIEKEAEKNNYRILLCNSESDLNRSRSSLALLSGHMVDGVITMDAISKLPELKTIIGDYPWVQCAEFDPDSLVASVGIDDISAAKFVVDQFVKSGKHRIAMVNHDLNYQYARYREQGYREQLAYYQLNYGKVYYAENLDYISGRFAARQILASSELPDAVFAVSDVLAAGIISMLTEQNIAIPQDIAVIGFDGMDISQITVPALSTIAQPCDEIGSKSVQLLLEQIENASAFNAQHHLLDWTFIQRRSS
ncbi:LacI family transcriptional regulator [Cricetibacter osteomyelitidis]|uniref:LacI family transcriptional regulator n=1 Tax=Cricetibacter osteomyelitidis TaxID=1521931 RepID=A0A4R2T1A5_9PAST|nr:LacI family DNA-binding transcriptional regulator [Cricetibacter osteomyelitidis]TCP95111.1 LacI family transcriptional regulator [Cricetibacter osteomyelitidis]